jgi:hypothetical protein
MSQRSVPLLSLLLCSVLWLGCFTQHTEGAGNGQEIGGKRGAEDADGGLGGDGDDGDDGDSCRTSEIQVANLDKVDMLFVVDNSGSMREEQFALRAQFEHMTQALTTGDADSDGDQDFPPATDLHLAVVSSDLGLIGITGIPNCDGLGDDGVMQSRGDTTLSGCAAAFPPFIAFIEGGSEAAAVANDFGCIASLGTEGCGFEQQLEAGLKALWPAQDRGGNGGMDPTGAVNDPNRFTFLGDPSTGFGTTGHGDGMNIGFLRNDPTVGLSVIAVIVVSDEEDCSSMDTRHFTPPQFLDPADPLAQQGLNLRCFFNPQNLFDVQRYVDGLQALRPDSPATVIFGAIVGVPPDLVDADARAGLDFGDEEAREAFYTNILNDPRMQELPDPTRTPEQGALLTPSCQSDNDGDGEIESRAFPPRRIVEVARRFGASGMVQSICQADFAEPITAIVGTIGRQLGAVCLPRKLERGDADKVDCDVLWELPAPGAAPASTPVSCDQRPWLRKVERGGAAGEVCVVTQLPVENRMVPDVNLGEGWFYDDFSAEALQTCTNDAQQRIAFTAGAKPPTGVRVRLDCCDD